MTGSWLKPALRSRLCAVASTSPGPTVTVARSPCGRPTRSLRSPCCSRWMKPWSSIQKSLNSFDRYLLPVSQAKVTTRFGADCSRHQRSAAATSVPVEEPTSSPSLRRISRDDGEGLGVRNAVALAAHREIADLGNEVLADALDQPGARLAVAALVHLVREHRALRVREDHLDRRQASPEELREAGDRAARADADDDGVEASRPSARGFPGRSSCGALSGCRDCRTG